MVFENVRAAIAKQLECSEDTITMDSKLVDDLKADSLDIVELIFNLEEAFDISIGEEEDDDLENMVTVGDIVKYVESRM